MRFSWEGSAPGSAWPSGWPAAQSPVGAKGQAAAAARVLGKACGQRGRSGVGRGGQIPRPNAMVHGGWQEGRGSAIGPQVKIAHVPFAR